MVRKFKRYGFSGSDEAEIATMLENFINDYADFNVTLEIPILKGKKLFNHIIDLENENYDLIDEVNDLETDIENLNGEISTLERSVEELTERLDIFPESDGNSDFKKRILVKAFSKYTLQELEEKLNIDWLEL